MEMHLIQDRKKNYYHHHNIPFNLKGNENFGGIPDLQVELSIGGILRGGNFP